MSNIKFLTNPIVDSFLASEVVTFEEFLVENSSKSVFKPYEIAIINELKIRLDKIKNREYVKNQHFVPQFYLRLFTKNSDAPESRLETLDLKLKKIIRPQSPSNVCS